MKIPSRILGLLVGSVAAPLIAGCAGEVTDEPSTNTTESNLQSQAPDEDVSQPSAPTTPAAHPAPSENAPAATPEPPAEPEQSEDPCPACGMG